MLNPNTSAVTLYQGHIQATTSQSLAAHAVNEAMKEARERHIGEVEQLETRRYVENMDQEEFQSHRKQLLDEFNQRLISLSIDNQVLHAMTALIAKKKIVDVNTGAV